MKTFLVVLLVLIGAIVAGFHAMPKPEFTVETRIEPDAEEIIEESRLLENGTYTLVGEGSSMRWKGSRPLIKGYFDNGVITISDGRATIASGSLTKGEIIIDMTSIRAESTGRERGQSLLTRDLKSDNWFNVEQYPESLFVFTSYEENVDGTITITGELTIKDTTDTLSFPARIVMREGRLILEATDIEVDRTVWDIRYQSGSFFSDLGEKLIDDIFTLTFTAVFEAVGE